MKKSITFDGYTIVSCGTLRGEIKHLKTEGFFNNIEKILYTTPGLHEKQRELEKQLTWQIENAKKYSDRIIVVYGERCFLDPANYSRNIDKLIHEIGSGISRIQARTCIDMLAEAEEREKIRAGRKVYWLTPGWIKYWKIIFSNWDNSMANETFPANDVAIVLDGINAFNTMMEKSPEDILEFSDWMKLEIEPYKISLNRFKKLFLKQLRI